MSRPVLLFEHVSFSYGERQILSDISFEINEGAYVGVVGPNGGGKTTILKLTLGLLKPANGRIELLGATPLETRSQVGYVPQYFNVDRKFPISVADTIGAGLLNPLGHLVCSKEEASKRIREALSEVRLQSLEERAIGELSGGELQRVLIARALVSRPRILMFDEPTANVDPAVGQDLNTLFKELNQDHTVILVSHDVGFVVSSVSQLLCINQTIHAHDTTCLDEKTIEKLYGGHMHLVNHHHDLSPKGQEEAAQCHHS